ncbi:ATP-binding protein [Photobacterium swingsii]|uniref:ATP-binding protein n=1 Tax=Photobacterium swingsii TaxID=680026 RepID=UPI004068DF93
MQPINPKNSLSNNHVSLISTSGGGKTSAVKKLFIKPTDQAVFFDPYGDYEGRIAGRMVRTYEKWGDFTRAVLAGRKTNQGFKIAKTFRGEPTHDDFERFAQIVWGCGNGNHAKPLKAVFEECAQFADTSGKAKGTHGSIMRVGRKFGIHAINPFQRGQEVPKTILGNSRYKWVGIQARENDAKYLAAETGIPLTEILNLKKLEYFLKDGDTMNCHTKDKLRF